MIAVAWVARCPSLLVLVEILEEHVSLADDCEPRGDVDGLGEVADVFGNELVRIPSTEYVVG